MAFACLRLFCLCSVATGYVSIRRTQPDGSTTQKPVQTCSELAPGVNYCQDLGEAGVDIVVDVHYKSHEPQVCKKRVNETAQLLMHYTGRASLAPADPSQWSTFVAVEDFTHALAVKLGVGEVVKGWDMALVGMCQGTHAVITIPPSLGFDHPDGFGPPRPGGVPAGATLRYEVEIVSVLHVDEQGVPYRPCFFSLIDTDHSGYIDEVELAHHFARIKQPVPPHVMNEDKDGDGRISWEEFTGPKAPLHIPRDEL